jgi:hypothetical protein
MEVKELNKKILNGLSNERKAELDNYSQEEINFLWNVFTQEETNYIERVDMNK